MASEALLLWGLVFSSIGLGFFVYGKKQHRGVAIFAIDFSGRPARKISKNHATANAFGGPDSSCLARIDPTRGRNIATQ